MYKINISFFLIFCTFYSVFSMDQEQLNIVGFSRETLLHSLPQFFCATMKFIEGHNSQIISFGSKKSLRLVSQGFLQLYEQDENVKKLIHFYNNRFNRTCFFLDRVYRGTPQEVKTLLVNSAKFQTDLSFCVNYYDNFRCDTLTPFMVAHHRNNTEIIDVFETLSSSQKTGKDGLNIDLCIAACVGDIKMFEQFYVTSNAESKKASIPLVIWAATKNCDIKFLNHLKTHEEYKEYMLHASDKFLRQILISGYDWSNIQTVPLDHFQKVKKLIESNCFSLSIRNHDCQFTWNQRAMDYFRDTYEEYQDSICGQYFKMIHWFTAQQYCKELNIDIEEYVQGQRRTYEAADMLGELEEDIFKNLHREQELAIQNNAIPPFSIVKNNNLLKIGIGLGSIVLLYGYLKYYYKKTE